MYRSIMPPLDPRRIVGALLALITGASNAVAQDERPFHPECGRPIQCVAAPCVQPPPCPVRNGVERTARDVRVTLEGRVLRYEVTEQWTNRGRSIGEADYVLPLPRGAAFEDLALEIDGEMVTGEALGAGQARAIYEEIVRKQRDPALVEWMGMGVLRTRIFPIQPGETRTVKVRFRAVAEREGDALRIDVPAPRGQGTTSGTTLRFRWPAGNGFGDAWSPTHRMEMNRESDRRVALIDDAAGTVTVILPVRDTDRAAISVLTHAPQNEDGYALITLAPPSVVRRATARDITFVIDVSGSMAGTKLVQAKAAGRQLLNSLGQGDRFRIISFSNDVDEFRDGWTPATAQERSRAGAWIDDLNAVGGTNIMGAMERALESDETNGRLNLVLFMTDGAPTVGERRAERIAARAGELRGQRRVFTFGVGADLNAGLLEQLALDGAGTAHFVRPEEDVERVVGVVAQRLQRPVATNLRVRASGVQLRSIQPAGRLDLFAGQELTVLARYRVNSTSSVFGQESGGRITITGDTPDGPVTWEARANFPSRRPADAFVGRLWATQRVGWLSAERRKNGASSEIDNEMKQLGERWGIPTELTSYLVLEPGMQPVRASTGAQSTVGATDATRRLRTDGRLEQVVVTGAGSGNASVAAAAPPATVQQFERAKSAAEMRESRSIALNDSIDASGRRRTTTRTFALRDGVWTDDRAKAADGRVYTIKPFSPAYFAAMERIPELREIFALGEKVEVHGRAMTIRLTADGMEQLDERALTALGRDW